MFGAAHFLLAATLMTPPQVKMTGQPENPRPAEVPAAQAQVPSPPKSAALSVRLTGSPAEDVWFEITPLLSQVEPTVISLPTGKDQLDIPQVPVGPLLICAGAKSRATTCVRFLGGGEPVMVELLDGTAAVGRCVRDGMPVGGAKVSLVPARLAAQRAFTVPLRRDGKRLIREVVSDPSGRLTLGHVSPGEYLLQIVSPGGRIETAGPVVVAQTTGVPNGQTKTENATLDLGDLVIQGGATVTVVVTDNMGAPLLDAKVGANQGKLPNVIFFTVTTNHEGRAALSGFDPLLPVTTTCQKMGYKTMRQSFASLPAVVVCALDPLATVTGSVIDRNGDAVPGATVSLRVVSLATTSDRRGSFKLINVDPGSWELLLTAPGFDLAKRTVELRPGEDRDIGRIELSPGTDLQGLVRDGPSGQPVVGAIVACENPPGIGQTSSGVDGTFSLSVQRHEASFLTVNATGYPTTRRTVEPSELDSEHQLVIELNQGGRLRVSAWDDESDAPCAGCSIAIATAGSDVTSLTTDSNGEVESSPIAPGTYWVALQRLQTFGAVYHMSGGDAQQWVDISAGATASVQLGSPPVRVTLRLNATLPPAWRLVGIRPSGVSVAEPLGGTLYLVKYRRGEPMRLWLQSANGSQVAVGALSAEFAGTSSEIDLPQSGVRGQLLASGVGVSGQRLDILAYSSGQVTATILTESGGFFSCPYLSSGMFAVTADRTVLGTFVLANQQQLELGQFRLSTP